jgi:hypothetical protein
MEELQRFLHELDDALKPFAGPGERLNLYQIGRMSLVQHFHLPNTTRDFDVLREHDSPLLEQALKLFGKDTERARRLGIYLEIVPEGLPPIPAGYRTRCVDVPGPWSVLRLRRPDPYDLAVTKLKRFAAKDREDIQFLCDHGHVSDINKLRQVLDSAFLWVHEKDDDPDRERAFNNLERVREYLEGRIQSL